MIPFGDFNSTSTSPLRICVIHTLTVMCSRVSILDKDIIFSVTVKVEETPSGVMNDPSASVGGGAGADGVGVSGLGGDSASCRRAGFLVVGR